MNERKYTVEEIDALRAAVTELLRLRGPSHWSVAERAEDIERHLRTYMLNGTQPAELEPAIKAAFEERAERDRQRTEMQRRIDALVEQERLKRPGG